MENEQDKPTDGQAGQGTATEPAPEPKYHSYITNKIPWFVHVIWVCFWIFAIWYIISYQLPIVKEEFLSPP